MSPDRRPRFPLASLMIVIAVAALLLAMPAGLQVFLFGSLVVALLIHAICMVVAWLACRLGAFADKSVAADVRSESERGE